MNFLADENVDRQIVDRLRQEGHIVLYVVEMQSGISDTEVLNRGNRTESLLLTADKDFGELVFRQKRIALGVILLRLAGLSVNGKADIVAAAVSRHAEEFPGTFTVISPGVVRIRRRMESKG